VDDAAVRRALAGLVADDEVADVVIEGDWLAVVIGREDAPRSLVIEAHERLSSAFPGVEVEVRAGPQVYRGGRGFGAGRHVVAVLGGKGGVGKSTLAVNLALTLSAMGHSVGLMDGDLSAPDLPHLLGVHPKEAPRGFGWQLMSTKVRPPSQRRRPYERFGVEVMSVGFVVPERMAPMLAGRTLVSTILRYLVFEVVWRADVLVIDAPPGTGDELQTMARELPLSGAVFVTTPQDLAQMDAERTLALLTEHDVPVIGWVQNMAELTCPHCDERIDLFARSARLSEAGLPVLGRIPFDVRLSVTADQGRPLVLGDPSGPIAYEFAKIGNAVRKSLAEERAPASGAA
jgi:ATP-binding protein involved in chromosome partitioning